MSSKTSSIERIQWCTEQLDAIRKELETAPVKQERTSLASIHNLEERLCNVRNKISMLTCLKQKPEGISLVQQKTDECLELITRKYRKIFGFDNQEPISDWEVLEEAEAKPPKAGLLATVWNAMSSVFSSTRTTLPEQPTNKDN